MKTYVLDADNRPVEEPDQVAWAQWFGRSENRVVAWTQITSECVVSTVFLGLDHRLYYGSPRPPVLFETMIFGGPGSLDQSQWRYSSWDDAETGHKVAVRKVREAIGQKVRACAQPG